jgi:hypothetical protein
MARCMYAAHHTQLAGHIVTIAAVECNEDDDQQTYYVFYELHTTTGQLRLLPLRVAFVPPQPGRDRFVTSASFCRLLSLLLRILWALV